MGFFFLLYTCVFWIQEYGHHWYFCFDFACPYLLITIITARFKDNFEEISERWDRACMEFNPKHTLIPSGPGYPRELNLAIYNVMLQVFGVLHGGVLVDTFHLALFHLAHIPLPFR